MEKMNWLEPALEKRVEEVTKTCEIEANEIYDKFNKMHKLLESHIPLSLIGEYYELDSLFVQKLSTVRTAYRSGFNDGLSLIEAAKCSIK